MNKEITIKESQPGIIKVLAHFFSYIFHPLFIPLYAISFLVFFHPSYFAGFTPYEKYRVLLTTVLNTVFFPAFAVLLMRGLGFIKSIFLDTPQDRIGLNLTDENFRTTHNPTIGEIGRASCRERV